jgi:HAD superfamily hydrolase (TIGR01484 family)
MRYHALACDFDATLASEGRVPAGTLDALGRLKASGRSLLLVTGRSAEHFLELFPEAGLFSRIVFENGALLYRPEGRELEPLASAPPPEFLRRLRERGVDPLATGRVIVATRIPHEGAVLETIREMGLEMHVVFNRGAVMALPAAVTKASGLRLALEEIGLSPHNVVGVGDAENDHAFLELCECSVAVANALPSLKSRADWVTAGAEGEGVRELSELLLRTDLADLDGRLSRHEIPLGVAFGGSPILVRPHGSGILLAGTSGSGKSTLATGFFERLGARKYQFLIIDPEGDYSEIEEAAVLGTPDRAPDVKEVVEILESPGENLAVNLLAIPIEERPTFLEKLLAEVLALYRSTGRPHWLILDEAHHLLPEGWAPDPAIIPARLGSVVLITVHPEHLSPRVRPWIETVVALGERPGETLGAFARSVGIAPPAAPAGRLAPGEGILWRRGDRREAILFRGLPPRASRRRHRRKYAEGELGPDKSFYFQGPHGKLHLRAQNLRMFLHLADGVDDETWLHHLRGGDYSRWFREAIKDDILADLARRVEEDPRVDARESRLEIRRRIEERYTAPP